MIGIEFTYKDKTKESFDPVTDFKFNGDDINFYVGGYNYNIHIHDIESYREYELCEKCGYEIYEDGCHNCH